MKDCGLKEVRIKKEESRKEKEEGRADAAMFDV